MGGRTQFSRGMLDACHLRKRGLRVKGSESCADAGAPSQRVIRPVRSHKEISDKFYFGLFFFLVFMLKLAKTLSFSSSHPKKPAGEGKKTQMTGAIIYCTLYCIKYVTDITVHLYINILTCCICVYNKHKLYSVDKLGCIYVCKISGTY